MTRWRLPPAWWSFRITLPPFARSCIKDQPLAAIEAKRGQVNNLARQLRSKAKGSPNEEGKMSPAEQKKYVEEYRAGTISSEEDTMWNRGASNGGYHYLGCAKTILKIGKLLLRVCWKWKRIKTSVDQLDLYFDAPVSISLPFD